MTFKHLFLNYIVCKRTRNDTCFEICTKQIGKDEYNADPKSVKRSVFSYALCNAQNIMNKIQPTITYRILK